MNYSSRFFLYAPLALLLALAAFAATYWWRVADGIDARLAAMKGHEAIPGVTLDWSRVTLSGFPFRLDIVFDGLSVKGAGAHGPFAWQSDHFAVHALTYGAQKDVFEAAGNQSLSWTDAAGAAHGVTFLPAALHASAVRDSKGLSRFDLDIIGLAGKDFTAGRVQFHMRRDPDGKAIDLMAEVDGAKGDLGAFGTELKSLRLYQTLPRAEAFAGLLRGEMPARQSHALWLRASLGAKTTRLENGGQTPSPARIEAADALLAPLY